MKRSTTMCRCRNCGDRYQESKSRADCKGYCSQACMHEKARKLGYKGYRKGMSMYPTEYYVLKTANAIGSVFVPLEDI
jgi:hypothetical protein